MKFKILLKIVGFKFFHGQKGQAFVETILFVIFIYFFIAVGMIIFSHIQLYRQRLEMTNSYIGYTYGVTGQNVSQQAKEMLRQGSPIIDSSDTCFENLHVRPNNISVNYKIKSSFIKRVIGRENISLKTPGLKMKRPPR